jgi:hypothetical protein
MELPRLPRARTDMGVSGAPASAPATSGAGRARHCQTDTALAEPAVGLLRLHLRRRALQVAGLSIFCIPRFSGDFNALSSLHRPLLVVA